MLDKTYDPASVEQRLYDIWEKSGAFAVQSLDTDETYCIMMPPPNVTGSLHMGHALTFTVQDTLVRFHRMLGEPTLWQPGTDHAGIATQMLVERKLRSEGIDRRDIGRDAFLEHVWKWKAESGGAIVNQLRRLGASPDWDREVFTLDDDLSFAVRTAFVKMHEDGLIYRDKRLVNWDCALQTALSDLETVPKDVDGHLWHLSYPIENSPESITVATTRPETMLGDTAVAVHPEDERYTRLVGKYVILPLTGRRIPIIADSYSDPEKGSGAVKITPAHDFNDFEVGKRHDLAMISVLDKAGKIAGENLPEAYVGLDRMDARDAIVADLTDLGLVVAIESHRHVVPFSDRSDVVVEPMLTDQWYCDAATLAKPAIEAVEQGTMRFVPKQWENFYFEWMRNIQPWCISRQLWWGHRIPAWYGPDETVFVAYDEAEALTKAKAHYGEHVELRQDEDVLDTWFSSGLWPLSTLGWPKRQDEIDTFYPTSVLVTGFDIIFFWVARMMMMCMYFQKDVPFRDIYIHGLIRDEKNEKMSKTKGNVIDPLDLIDQFGTDALRFSILSNLAQGRDIKFSAKRVETYRNFVTKLWNAARFAEMNEAVLVDDFDPASVKSTINQWMIGELARASASMRQSMLDYDFAGASQTAWHLTWSTFCDWYLELSKPALAAEADAQLRTETRQTLGYVTSQLMALLQPMIPFVTTEIGERLFGVTPEQAMSASYPDLSALPERIEAQSEVADLIALISDIRAARAAVNVPVASKTALYCGDVSDDELARLQSHSDALGRLARIADILPGHPAEAKGVLQVIVGGRTYALPVGDVIDIDEEKQRMAKEIQKVEKEIAKVDGKLANEKFMSRAPEEIIAENRQRKVDFEKTREELQEAIKRLDG